MGDKYNVYNESHMAITAAWATVHILRMTTDALYFL